MAVQLGVNAGFVDAAPVADPSGIGTRQLDTYARGQQDTSPDGSDLYVDEILWWCDNATEEANWEAAIYDDTGGNVIQNVVGSISATNAKGTSGGEWKSTGPGLNIPIDPLTLYWITVQLDDTSTNTNVDYSNNGDRYAYAIVDTLSDPFGAASYSTTGPLAICAVVKSGGGTVYNGTISESAATSDQASSAAVFGGSVSESAGISDTPAGQATIIGNINESSAIADALSAIAILIGTIGETAAITDFVTAANIIYGTIAESAAISDELTSIATFLSSISETASLTDNYTSQASLFSAIAESASLADVITAIGQYAVSIQESAGIADTQAGQKISSVTINETAVIADILEIILGIIESQIITRCYKKQDIISEQEKHRDILRKIKKHIDIINQVTQGRDDRCH